MSETCWAPPDCAHPAMSRGLCSGHYERLKRPLAPRRRALSPDTALSRFLRRIRHTRGNPRTISPIRICAVCGEPFIVSFETRKPRVCGSACGGRQAYKKAARTNPHVEKTCAHCGETFRTNTHASRRMYCNKECARRADRYAKNLRDRANGRTQVSTRHRTSIYERGGGVCGVCHELIDRAVRFPNPMSFTIDHINGNRADNRPENLQPTHNRCNIKKGNRAA